MATSLNPTPAAFCLSSMLPDLRWSTDQAEVRVRLYYQHPGETLIDTTLTAQNGYAKLYETRELIERFMRNKGLARAYPINIQHLVEENGFYWQGDGALTVLFCEKNLSLPNDSPTEWLERNFLSTISVKPLPSIDEAVEQLYFVQPQGTPQNPSLHVTYIDDSGSTETSDIQLSASYNPSATNLFVCEFSINSLLTQLVDAVTIVAVTVSVGDRHMEYYRPARRENVAFRFLNAFNVLESAYLNAIVNRKTDDGRKLANVSGSLVHYDRKPVTEYEVETSPLSFEEASWIDQLITSPEVTLLDGTSVIITDGKAECHNDNSELNKAKFTYKELDQRHTITTEQQAANIFTVPPHSYQFN